MSKKIISKPLTIIMGTALVGGLTAAAAVNAEVTADENPFAMEELSGGQLFAGDGEGSCGEGKCGENKGDDEGEGSCGEGGDSGDDEGEGSCGGASA